LDKIVNLKLELDLIPQYVELRNNYTELLMTDKVGLEETLNWLKTADIEIRGMVINGVLEGVVILYLNRKNEVAIFSRCKVKGIGTKLLDVIRTTAFEKGLTEVWAWIRNDNWPATALFKKCGYTVLVQVERVFRGHPVLGTEYKKLISTKG
jgi:ribosomal protein S18 acetylase RimI-like enzyme